jgi:hypothetical protein
MRMLALGSIMLAAATFEPALAFDHAPFDALLKQHVVEVRGGLATQVDYGGLRRDRAQLESYLKTLSAVTPSAFAAWDKSERLAFLINAYNAWTLELVLTGDPQIKSIKDLGSLVRSPWKKRFIALLGQTRSLDDIEHGMIRAEGVYEEPRIHFAVNCASIGCPALRREAYTGARLQAQLEQATQAFLRDRSRNRLEGGVLKMSSIFEWYAEDFERGWGGFESLAQFLARYAEALGVSPQQVAALRSGDLEIEYLSYDWRLNRVP